MKGRGRPNSIKGKSKSEREEGHPFCRVFAYLFIEDVAIVPSFFPTTNFTNHTNF